MISSAIAHVDFAGLRKVGFNAVVVDKDNCVVSQDHRQQREQLMLTVIDAAKSKSSLSTFCCKLLLWTEMNRSELVHRRYGPPCCRRSRLDESWSSPTLQAV